MFNGREVGGVREGGGGDVQQQLSPIQFLNVRPKNLKGTRIRKNSAGGKKVTFYLANVFSKLAMSQGLGPKIRDQEDLQGWPNAFAFLSIDKYQFGILCKFEVNVFSKLATFQGLGPIPCD